MKIGIVGSDEDKWDAESKQIAMKRIRARLSAGNVVVSGACPKGGVDIWAVQIAKEMGLPYVEFPPKGFTWAHYKARNIQIVEASDMVICLTPRCLPSGKKLYCYHCETDDHVRSGGCWTLKEAKRQGKQTQLIII